MQTSKKDLAINNYFFVKVIKTNNINGKTLNTPLNSIRCLFWVKQPYEKLCDFATWTITKHQKTFVNQS
jgi:hypothetical protein